MKEYRPIEISNGGFNFCKYTIAVLLWISFAFQNKFIVIFCFAILLISAVVKVKRAPLVAVYAYSVDKVFPSRKIVLDESAIRFAHTVGAVFSGIALVFIYNDHPFIGWILIGVLAFLKTSGAFGFCGAAKLYSCLNNPNGKCCRVGKKVKKCTQD